MSMRPRYTLIPSSDESERWVTRTPSSPSLLSPEDDEEEMLTRPPPPSYPRDPRFERPEPPAWQRVALILTIVGSMALAVWLQNGWSGAVIFD